MKPVKCYASGLGDCNNIQSYEHYISQGLFTNNLVTLQGHSWLKGGEKTVGKKKIGLPILCRHHNSLLSPVDKINIKYARYFEESFVNSILRGKLSRSALWQKDSYNVNGFILEQWMVKAAVGCLCENPASIWHDTKTGPLKPPNEILQAVFGLSKLQEPMGLYLTMSAGEKIANEQRFGLEPLIDVITNGVVGVSVNFLNLNFLIWLSREPNYSNFPSWTKQIFGPSNQEPIYRIKEFIGTTKGKISSIIKFNWDDAEPLNLYFS